MTAKTAEEALALERTRGDEYLARIRADAWRAGYAAGLEAAAQYVEMIGDYSSETRADGIRSLDIPEATNG